MFLEMFVVAAPSRFSHEERGRLDVTFSCRSGVYLSCIAYVDDQKPGGSFSWLQYTTARQAHTDTIFGWVCKLRLR
jgi:hypothetical protein